MANIKVPGSESMLSNEMLPNIQLKQAVRELVSILYLRKRREDILTQIEGVLRILDPELGELAGMDPGLAFKMINSACAHKASENAHVMNESPLKVIDLRPLEMLSCIESVTNDEGSMDRFSIGKFYLVRMVFPFRDPPTVKVQGEYGRPFEMDEWQLGRYFRRRA
ncbi:Uncharacterised protein [Pseudomonas putida]|nr:Uncharacterised protein [Pseudomonas putida]